LNLRLIEYSGSPNKPEAALLVGQFLLTGPKEDEEEYLFPNKKFGIMYFIFLKEKGTIYAC
jgi:hypothetical protein